MSIWQKIKNCLFDDKSIKQEFQEMLEAEEKMFAASSDEQTKEAEPVKKTGKKAQARKSPNKKKK